MKIIVSIVLLCAAAASARAEEPALQLKTAPGVETVAGNCSSCHSLDYILTNSPFLTRAAWEAEVTKMIAAYGAPISEDDAKTIVDYLAKNY